MGTIPNRDDLFKLLSMEEKVLKYFMDNRENIHPVTVHNQSCRVEELRNILLSDPEFKE